jgi:hypothetical protein
VLLLLSLLHLLLLLLLLLRSLLLCDPQPWCALLPLSSRHGLNWCTLR